MAVPFFVLETLGQHVKKMTNAFINRKKVNQQRCWVTLTLLVQIL